jgi:four helix bundle protein
VAGDGERSNDGVVRALRSQLWGVQDFRKLLVWQRANGLGLRIDAIVRGWPRQRSAQLKGQLSRSADSIGTNIAEGCGAASRPEFARYLDIAIKSASETEHHVWTARHRELISGAVCDESVDEISQIRRMLHALRTRVRSRQ